VSANTELDLELPVAGLGTDDLPQHRRRLEADGPPRSRRFFSPFTPESPRPLAQRARVYPAPACELRCRQPASSPLPHAARPLRSFRLHLRVLLDAVHPTARASARYALGRTATGIFRKGITEADPSLALETLRNSVFSAFLVGQQAARLMRDDKPNASGAKGTIIFTNASAALKGFPLSGAFAMACQAKSDLAHSMARELMPDGIHIVNVSIDAAIGWTQEDGTRAHRLPGTSVDDNMADPDRIAETYLQLHRQHRSIWAFEVVLRPWLEKW